MTDNGAPVLFYVPFPPPATGQRIASETFFGMLQPHIDVRHVPVRGQSLDDSAPRWRRVSDHLGSIERLVAALRAEPGATVYFCPASSAVGLLRDVAMLKRIRRRAGRVVAHVHSGNYPIHWAGGVRQRLARWLAAGVDAWIVPTETQAVGLREVIRDRPIHVVTNVVDDAVRVDDSAMQAVWEQRKASGETRVLYLSNFVESKGYRDVLEALAHTASPVIATFAGAWTTLVDRAAFLARAQALGVADRVHLHPPVSRRSEVARLLAEADVVALPTSYPAEAQPLAILEGMATGCVIVATPHASIPEYVRDGQTGRLVPPADPASLARALDALADPADRRRLGEAGRALAGDLFSDARALPPLLAALGHPILGA